MNFTCANCFYSLRYISLSIAPIDSLAMEDARCPESVVQKFSRCRFVMLQNGSLFASTMQDIDDVYGLEQVATLGAPSPRWNFCTGYEAMVVTFNPITSHRESRVHDFGPSSEDYKQPLLPIV